MGTFYSCLRSVRWSQEGQGPQQPHHLHEGGLELRSMLHSERSCSSTADYPNYNFDLNTLMRPLNQH